MTLIWLASIASASAPAVDVTWKGSAATLSFAPPADQKVADDAPATLVLTAGDDELEVRTQGAALTQGVSLGDLRGAELEGELEVGLCQLDGTQCRPTRWMLHGIVPDAKKGTASLEVVERDRLSTQRRRFGPGADGGAGDAALARAAANGRPALLGFSAVWCEPCNRFAAEVMDAPPEELGAFEPALIDSDNPATWALAKKYGITGYPTFVVTGPDGVERTRLVGYTTRDDFLAWLSTSTTKTDGVDLASDPSTVDPKRAAVLAWQLVYRLDEDLAGPWLARADHETVEYRLAHATLESDPEDVRWVLEHEPSQLVWILDALPKVAEKDPELARTAVAHVVATSTGADLSEALSVAAELEPDAARQTLLYQSAASVLRGELTGDPAHDKGHIKNLANLEVKAGDPEVALVRLREASTTWPNEPTFYLSSSRLLLKLKRYDEALAEAEKAVAVSWGDNRLRAAIARSKVYVEMGRPEDAASSARVILAEPGPDPEGLSTRATKHRRELEAFVAPQTASK